MPSILLGLLLFILIFASFFKRESYQVYVLVFIVLLYPAYKRLTIVPPATKHTAIGRSMITVHESHGILGQIKISDVEDVSFGDNYQESISLRVNNINQTLVRKDKYTTSYWSYVHQISATCSFKEAGAKVLLLGFGAGSLVTEFERMDFEIDAIELDERIPQLAKEYFNFKGTNTRVVIDDARHFIEVGTKRYDIIVMDIAKAESQPSYLYSEVCFKKISTILNDDGLLIVNYQGTLEGVDGLTFRSIHKTISSVNLHVQTLRPQGIANDLFHDMIFVVSKTEFNYNDIDFGNRNHCCAKYT